MPNQSTSHSTSILVGQYAYLSILISASLFILLLVGPIAQPAHYHEFADQRMALGIPHFMDVLSNLPFLIVGLLGIRAASSLRTSPARTAWQAFFIAVTLTTFGSSFYHWLPNDFGLLIDRLPIACACAWLCCALLAERINGNFGKLHAIVAAGIVAIVSTVYWYATQLTTQGAGDLRPYLFVQFAPMLLVPLCIYLSHNQTKPYASVHGKAWALTLALYAVAKAFELADHALLHVTGFISGHTVKHLLAAAAAFCLVHALSVALSVAQRSQALKLR